MSFRRVFRLPARARIAAAVDDELRFHIEGRIEDFVARGMTREAAEAEARRRFGDYEQYRHAARHIDEQTMRTRNRLELLDTFRREMRHSARALLRTPAFSAIALATLALGIGATTAIWTVLEAVALRPLPYRGAERLVAVLHPATVPGNGETKWGLSPAGFFYFQKENRTLESLGMYVTGYTSVSGDGDAEQVRTGRVTHTLLATLGATPAAGRMLVADDDRPGATPVVVLGYDFWQRRYGGDLGVVGKSIQLSNGPVEVVGVMRRGFDLPKPGPFETVGAFGGARVDLWSTLRLDPAARPVNTHPYFGVGRLKPGVTAEEAERDLETLHRRLPELFPGAYSPGFMKEYNFRMGVQSLRDEVLGDQIARTLWVLFGAVGLVLLIACANVANLFLVRMEARRRESAIRTALGASRPHLVAHYLSESLTLALVAGAVGLLLARGAVGALVAMAPAELPRLGEIALRGTSVAFALLLSVAIGVVFGLFPLFRGTIDTATLREGSRGLSPSPRQRAVRSGLVVSQVALALVLLALAGLMVRSFAHLRAVKPGLDPKGVLAFTIALPGSKYRTPEAAAVFYQSFSERLAALPGVTSVGAASGLPLRDFGTGCTVVFRETPFGPDEQTPCVATPRVLPGFYQTLGIDVRGRVPDWGDARSSSGAVVVTKALADRLWPGQDPIGKGINSNGGGDPGAQDWYRVVGVIPELRAAGLDREPTEAVFYPPLNLPRARVWSGIGAVTYVVRTSSSEPTALAPAVRRELAALDPTVPVADVRTMEEIVARSTARSTFMMMLLAVAAGMALLLSAVGIYGVISYVVAQRRSEIGVRIALGASVAEVARLVVMQSVRLAVLGVVLGLAGAYAGTRVIRSLLFETSPTDPLVLGVVPLVLLAIAVAASFAPARRAASVSPVEALRSQ